MACSFCKDLNEEKEDIKVTEIYISGAGYYGYGIPINYCPKCGEILKKYIVGQKPKLL